MSKTTAISMIVVALLLVTGALVWWYVGISGDFGSGGEENENGESSGFNFFPFGNKDGESPRGEEVDEEVVAGEEGGVAPVVRKITSSPVAGFTLISNSLGEGFTRYVEGETGNVFEAPLETISTKRLANTTVPKIRSVLWLPGGEPFLARYVGEDEGIETFSATISLTSSTSTESRANDQGFLGGRFLAKGIFDVSLVAPKDPSAKTPAPRIFYMTENEGGGSSGFLSSPSGVSTQNVFSSSLKEWLSFPTNEQTILLQTKPSGVSGGFLFSLTTRNGSLQKLLGPVVGLSVLPNKNGSLVLFSEILQNGSPRISFFNPSSKEVSRTNVSTFAEKCAWGEGDTKVFCAVPKFLSGGSGEVLPDDWYKGKTSFADSLWEIDAKTFTSRAIADLVGQSVFVDADLISVSRNNEFVVFRNKWDSSLWSVRLTPTPNSEGN